MSKADAKYRHAPHHVANCLHRVVHRLRVAGTIGEKDAIRLQIENILGTRLSRNYCDFATLSGQHTEDIVLDAEVVSHHVRRFAIESRRKKEMAGLIAAVGVIKLVNKFRRNW